MRHVATVFSRHFDKCSFDERADTGDLPQERLAPRHEPILGVLCSVHGWTVYIRANICNKKSACDNIFLSQTPDLASLAAFPPSIQPPLRTEWCDNSGFLKA
jgi:hypothetical protein